MGTGPELNFPGEAASSSMILQDGPILSDRELKKLKEHKYSSSCNTMLDPTMQKYELLTKPIGQKNSNYPMGSLSLILTINVSQSNY